MKLICIYLFIGSTLIVGACRPPLTTPEQLQSQIEAAFRQVPGTFALAFREVGHEENCVLIGERENFHAASTMKTPVMVELFAQAAEGRFALDDSIEVKNEFYSIVDSSRYSMQLGEDSEEELYQHIGRRLPIYQLMHAMITRSSNLATNLLIDLVDARKVTQRMRALGMKDIQVLRGVEDLKAYQQGLSNTTTAYDLMLLYELLGKREVVSPQASEQMIAVLLQQEFNHIIPAKLPKEVKVAHKTGSITGLRHDSGLVMLPDGRQYALVLLSRDMPRPEEGVEMMAAVSRMVFDYMNQRP